MADYFRAASRSLEAPGQLLELAMRAQNLPNLDLFSKSDPFVIAYMKSGGSLVQSCGDVSSLPPDGEWYPVGMTETV